MARRGKLASRLALFFPVFLANEARRGRRTLDTCNGGGGGGGVGAFPRREGLALLTRARLALALARELPPFLLGGNLKNLLAVPFPLVFPNLLSY